MANGEVNITGLIIKKLSCYKEVLFPTNSRGSLEESRHFFFQQFICGIGYCLNYYKYIPDFFGRK